ncbi:MAG: hypothetical protein BWX88_00948 [Planctomycetes bacterium ADurb.Bin126]|nr:MAG: hypothetical protein BWX88_00948 [Planctomycetes bacterium ADurb.Bin126]HOD81005.1 hypothetical protein [Phycisphaerae bacterium]
MNGRWIFVLALAGWGAVLAEERPGPLTDPGDAPATAPADKPKVDRERLIAPHLRLVRESENYKEVMSAYARGCAIDRHYAPLHDAYMRRMLKYGMPQIALYPARVLVNVDPQNGMAWGVVGYMHGKKEELVEAFHATIRAAQYEGEDPSILHNAGQLVAWYERSPDTPRVSDAARRILTVIRPSLAKQEAFTKSYTEMCEAYRVYSLTESDYEIKVAAAEGAVQNATAVAQGFDRTLREINDRVELLEREIDRLYRELRYTYQYPRGVDADGTFLFNPYPLYRSDLRRRIREGEANVDALKLDGREVRRKGEAALEDLGKKKTALDNLRKDSLRAMARLDRQFRWDPPAVDGVVTPERDRFPAATRPVIDPNDVETQAAQQLSLGQLYLRNGMHDRATEILERIVAKFPKTKAGQEAARLLKEK